MAEALKIAEEVLEQRRKYLGHLFKELKSANLTITEGRKLLVHFQETAGFLEELNKNVEHASIIPLGKNIYVNAQIKHTGEFFVDELAFPEAYKRLETIAKSSQILVSRTEEVAHQLEKSQNEKKQIEERIRLLQEEMANNNEAPLNIVTDRGIAMKVGSFYEIFEFKN